MIDGIPITVLDVLCKPPVFVRWARPHRRPRIAKKWRRFGAIETPCTGVAYEMLGELVVCPCQMKLLQAHFERQRVWGGK